MPMSTVRRIERRQCSLLVIAFSLLALSAAACQRTASEKAPQATGAVPTVTVPVDLPVTIALAGSFTYPVLQTLDKQIAAFEAVNPDLRIEIVRVPKDADQRSASIAEKLGAGDSSIDLYVLEAAWAADLAARGWLLPLNGYLSSSGSSAAAFLPAAIRANTFDGQIVALPWSADAGLVYYRRDLLDRLGYKPPASWAELQQMALTATEIEDLAYGYLWPGAVGEPLTCITLEWIWSLDPKAQTEDLCTVFDHPTAELALQEMYGLVASGASPPDLAAYDEGKALSAFMQGDVLFIRGGFGAWDYLNSQQSPIAGLVGIAPLPQSCLAEKALALSAHSLRPDRAWRFLAFLADYEQQVEMAQAAHQPPAHEAAYRDTSLLQAYPPLEPLYHALQRALSRPPDPDYAAISAIIAFEVNRMLAGEQDPSSAAGAIRRRLAEIPVR